MSHADQWFGDKTYSQHGEDLLFLNIFHKLGIKNPTYLDIGSHHPWNINNTALLYARGHRGINVEPNPWLHKTIKEARPEDINLMIGVSTKKGLLTYYMIDTESGRNSFSKEEVDRFIKEHPAFKVKSIMSVETQDINEIVNTYAGNKERWPDLLSIDAEGMDLEILKSALFTSKYGPVIVCIEANNIEQTRLINEELEKKGYHILIKMGVNIIAVPDWAWLTLKCA